MVYQNWWVEQMMIVLYREHFINQEGLASIHLVMEIGFIWWLNAPAVSKAQMESIMLVVSRSESSPSNTCVIHTSLSVFRFNLSITWMCNLTSISRLVETRMNMGELWILYIHTGFGSWTSAVLVDVDVIGYQIPACRCTLLHQKWIILVVGLARVYQMFLNSQVLVQCHAIISFV